MKRFSVLSTLIISLALSVAGCGGPSASTEGPVKSEAAKQDMTKVQMEMMKKAQGATPGMRKP
ncbi:MAG: hypothetical protein ACLQNE_43205 [Thermoguttaceae bacterium]